MGIEMTEESIPQRFLRKAVQACLDNVEQYIKDAQLLVENGSYGHGFAFAVLGEEELSKAWIYHMCSEGLLSISFIKKVGKTRHSHIRKQVMAGTLALTYKFIEFFKGIVESSWEEGGEDVRKRFEIARKELKEKTDDIRKNKEKYRHRFFQSFERIATLEEDKERGLYVDVKVEEGVLSSPKSLEKDMVEKHLAHVKDTFEFLKPLLMLTLPPSERERAKVMIKEYNALKDLFEVL